MRAVIEGEVFLVDVSVKLSVKNLGARELLDNVQCVVGRSGVDNNNFITTSQRGKTTGNIVLLVKANDGCRNGRW